MVRPLLVRWRVHACRSHCGQELAEHLADANGKRQSITLRQFHEEPDGRSTPRRDVTISTRCLNRVLQYDPRDLTISVEAGMPLPK